MANWYAVYTRPRWEKKVMESLAKRKIETYCPQTKAPAVWGERRKGVYQPLFTSYVFAKLNTIDFEGVKRIDGVINFLYWLGKPAQIRDIEIEMMRRFLVEHDAVVLEKGHVAPGEIVKLVRSTSSDDEKVIEMHTQRVKLVLPSLGYHLVATIANETIMAPEEETDPISLDATLAKIG